MATAVVADAYRLALAAELQDLIAHRVTAMEIQAGAAARLVRTAPAAANDALAAVGRLGQEAMGEIQRLGRLLDDGARAAMRPAPTLAHLDGLAGARVGGGAADVPAGVALCAVRAVELLACHAAPETVTVAILNGVVRIECEWEPGPEQEARLRTLARPCRGELRRLRPGNFRLDLPLAP
jgi:hypothetical protein